MADIYPNSALAIDCSGQVISAAIAAKTGFFSSETLEQTHGQAEALAPLVQKLLAQLRAHSCSNQYMMPEHLVVTVGPGGFTGLRVGLSFAIGLAAAAPGSKLWGLCTVDYWRFRLAQGHTDDVETWLAIDTRRQDAYVQRLNSDGVGDWEICLPETSPWQSRSVKVRGNAATKFLGSDPNVTDEEIDCGLLAKATLGADFRCQFLVQKPKPIYVREPAIHQKAKSA